MSGSVNKVTLVGNLGRDPEIRAMQNGDKIVQLSLATSDRWKDKTSGEQREKTEWHRVVIFNDALGRIAEQYLKKGSKVFIEGALQTRKWQDQSGNDRYSTEVVIQNYGGTLTMLDGRSGGENASGPSYNITGSGGNNSSSSSFDQGSQSMPSPSDLDDDIPF